MSQVDNGRQAHLEHALGRSLAVLRKAGADALIAASPANVRYLTGSSGWTHSMHITNQTYVVLTADGKKTLVIAGFMTHMCVSATIRSALDHGYHVTVASDAVATRDLPDPLGGPDLSAEQINRAALAELADRFAAVAPVRDIKAR